MKNDIEKIELKALSIRSFIIQWLASFADEEWQKNDWCSYGERSYSAQVENAYNMMLDDFGMERYVEIGEIPYDKIGWIFKTKEEAEVFYKFCCEFNNFCEDVPQRAPNRYYLNSPYFPSLVKASQEAIKEFLKNETIILEEIAKM